MEYQRDVNIYKRKYHVIQCSKTHNKEAIWRCRLLVVFNINDLYLYS